MNASPWSSAQTSAKLRARFFCCASLTSQAMKTRPTFSLDARYKGNSTSPPLIKSTSGMLALARLSLWNPVLQRVRWMIGSTSPFNKNMHVELTSEEATEAVLRRTKPPSSGTGTTGEKLLVSLLRELGLFPYSTCILHRLPWYRGTISTRRMCTASTGNTASPSRVSARMRGKRACFAKSALPPHRTALAIMAMTGKDALQKLRRFQHAWRRT
mmetsp:Transcript_87752/g.220876  ORF Transcript_87752/g.220876 Transcript_87752/m.220876 type:complete len:214 (+) Transcript_87752:439-1080(+)